MFRSQYMSVMAFQVFEALVDQHPAWGRLSDFRYAVFNTWAKFCTKHGHEFVAMYAASGKSGRASEPRHGATTFHKILLEHRCSAKRASVMAIVDEFVCPVVASGHMDELFPADTGGSRSNQNNWAVRDYTLWC